MDGDRSTITDPLPPRSKTMTTKTKDKQTMYAVVTVGEGGYDKLQYREDVVIPKIAEDTDIIVKVLAAGVNNTDINTRLGWYSKKVSSETSESVADVGGVKEKEDGGWNEKTPWPLVQGTDCCGSIHDMGKGVDRDTFARGQRVIVRPCWRQNDSFENIWMASDCDGAFAQYVRVPSSEVFVIGKAAALSDVELAALPCAYGTAENMLHRASVSAKDHVVVPGASGGVGVAILQLAKRRGATVTAICGAAKVDAVRRLLQGKEDRVLAGRPSSSVDWDQVIDALRSGPPVTVVVDNVGGSGFENLLDVVARGGRYVTSGAIAGPIVRLDFRTLYLRDLTLFGTTAWDPCVFPNLVRYVERGEIRPIVYKTYALKDIAEAQKEFSRKKHVGKIVLLPPKTEEGRS